MFNLIVEVDEFKHEGYDTTCELSRLNNLYEDLGHMPLVMVRFNPDAFKVGDVKYKSCFVDGKVRAKRSISHKFEDINYRLQVLAEHVKQLLKYEPRDQIEFREVHLFYDDHTEAQ